MITAIMTTVIAIFSILIFLVYERIEWLTGSMETHSDLMLRLQALKGVNGKPIELIWWDKSIEPFPTPAEHDTPVQLARIYIALPPRLRKNKPTVSDRVSLIWRRLKYGPAA